MIYMLMLLVCLTGLFSSSEAMVGNDLALLHAHLTSLAQAVPLAPVQEPASERETKASVETMMTGTELDAPLKGLYEIVKKQGLLSGEDVGKGYPLARKIPQLFMDEVVKATQKESLEKIYAALHDMYVKTGAIQEKARANIQNSIRVYKEPSPEDISIVADLNRSTIASQLAGFAQAQMSAEPMVKYVEQRLKEEHDVMQLPSARRPEAESKITALRDMLRSLSDSDFVKRTFPTIGPKIEGWLKTLDEYLAKIEAEKKSDRR